MIGNAYDVVIIGGGLSGLAAACYLAQEGKRVAVLDKRKSFGGRASTKEISGSFYNLGPHALYRKGEAVRILKELGVQLNGGTPSLEGKVFYNDRQYELPSNLLGILRTKLLDVKEKKEFIQMMLNIRKIDPTKYSQQTLEQWVENTIYYEKNKELLYMFGRLASYVNAPEIVNASAVLRMLQASLAGALYVNRGWQSIIEQLIEKAEMYGVTLLSNCTVEEIEVNTPICKVSFTEKEDLQVFSGRWIISTAPPGDLLHILNGKESALFRQLLHECIPVKAACLDMTIKSPSQSQVDFALDMNQSFYYSNHSKAAKLTYHPNHQVIHVMKYLKTNETATREQLLSFLEKINPQWQEQVISQRFSPSLVVSHRCPTVSNDNLAACAVKQYPGLLLAGEWVCHDYLLAEGALISVKRAVEQILKGV